MVNRIPQAQTSRESILAQLQALKAKEMDVSLHESKSKDGRYRVEIEGLPLSVTDALTTMRVPRRIVAQVKSYAERLAWETVEDD